MKKRSLLMLFSLLTVSAMLLSACGSTEEEPAEEQPVEEVVEEPVEEEHADEEEHVEEEEPVEEEMAELGSEGHPIKMLFVPSVNVDFMIASGDAIEAALNEATGLFFEVSVPTSYAATIEEMCASPTDTIGFIPAMGYALANQLCGVEPGLAAERFGWNVYWGQILVRRDSGIETLADLEGKTWGLGEYTSTSGFLVPAALFADAGLTPGEQIETGGHTESAQAVYNGDVDFGTTFFSPPLLPDGRWAFGDAPDIPDELIGECAPNDEGRLFCGGYRVLDARASIAEGAPDVIQMVKILAITPEIPNDTISFSPDFPDELKQAVLDGLTEYIGSEACDATICNQENFYGWTAVGPIADENFDGIRLMMEEQGITMENLGE
jgi:phosphonate transport system substrate-binding protein